MSSLVNFTVQSESPISWPNASELVIDLAPIDALAEHRQVLANDRETEKCSPDPCSRVYKEIKEALGVGIHLSCALSATGALASWSKMSAPDPNEQ